MTVMRKMWLVLALLPFLQLMVQLVQAQQSYVDNKQLDCYNHYNTTDGYVCNNDGRGGASSSSSCLSYLTFRSIPPYNSPTSIAYLLGSQPTQIAAANNVTDVDAIPTGTQILVPVNCSCSSAYFQHNASYFLKTSSDTYFRVANNTYQGLTTCQSLMAQNPYGDKNLTVGLPLQVPLRCACPSANQTSAGVNFLLTYMVTWGDDPSALAQRFSVDLSALLAANRLSPGQIIYPFTPILVPLASHPSPSLLQQPSSSSSPPPADSAPPGNSPSNNNKWIFVGVGVGAACLLLVLVLALALFLRRRHRRDGGGTGGGHYSSSSSPNRANPKLQGYSSAGKSAAEYLNSSAETKSWSSVISSRGLRHAVESLTVYRLEQVQRATDFFSEFNRIEGSSVFRASFEGDNAAIKVIKGDFSLSGDEINLLKRINHSNIIRLSGFCVHQGHSTTYLVYEYASTGSLAHCLHTQSTNKSTTKSTSRSMSSAMALSWQQRVQIAHDVADALHYLHNFTHPPYIHKNLKTSNILLDANLRAKVSNFSLARAIQLEDDNDQEAQALQLTRHVVGTHGYMAPEYIQNGVITPKLDVFAFGVVLLELLSGREAAATPDNDGLLLSASISRVLEGEHVRDKLEGFMDPSLEHEYPLELAFSMAQLAKSCVAPQINSRPTMAEALITLSKILSSTLDWDPSDADHLQHSSTSLGHRR